MTSANITLSMIKEMTLKNLEKKYNEIDEKLDKY